MRPVVQVKRWKKTIATGVEVEVIAVPWKVSYALGDRDCDYRAVDVPATSGHLWFWVIDTAQNTVVGHATFGAGDLTAQCDGIELAQRYRGRKIAYKLYRMAACLFEAPVVPAPVQSEEAKRFWNGRTELVCCQQRNLLRNLIQLGRSAFECVKWACRR